jgi:hypothetical protein
LGGSSGIFEKYTVQVVQVSSFSLPPVTVLISIKGVSAMTTIQVTKHQCDVCKRLFDFKKECRDHERTSHMCPKCDHAVYIDNQPVQCEMKRCSFKPNELYLKYK